MSLVLGCDIGFTATGLVLINVPASTIVACAVVRTERQAKKRGIRVADDDAERCCLLRRGILKFVNDWKLESESLISREGRLLGIRDTAPITGIVAELPHAGAKSARAIRSMALATGAVVATLDELGLPVEYVTPRDVKLITGSAKADKEMVEYAVLSRLTFPEPGPAHHLREYPSGLHEHIFDAAAAVLAAWNGTVVRMARQGREVGK